MNYYLISYTSIFPTFAHYTRLVKANSFEEAVEKIKRDISKEFQEQKRRMPFQYINQTIE